MAGLPKKYAKLGGGFTKKAWRLWKLAKAKTKRLREAGKKAISKPKKKTTMQRITKVNKMAKKKEQKKKRKPTITFFNTDGGKAIVNVGGGSLVAMGSTALLEFVPVVNTLPTLGKAGVQAGMGTVIFMVPVKKRLHKRIRNVIGTGFLIGASMTGMLPMIRKTKWGAKVFLGPVNKMANSNRMTDYQKSRLGKYDGGKSIRTNTLQGPWKEESLAGPVDHMAGPVNEMGYSNFQVGNTDFKVG